MPHLQFEINRSLADAEKISFAEQVRKLFSEVMDTGTDHISISIREFGTHNLSIGRVKEPEKGGEDFHLLEKYLASWQEGEDPPSIGL